MEDVGDALFTQRGPRNQPSFRSFRQYAVRKIKFLRALARKCSVQVIEEVRAIYRKGRRTQHGTRTIVPLPVFTDAPVIDVPAPPILEFEQGAMPCRINLPLMNSTMNARRPDAGATCCCLHK